MNLIKLAMVWSLIFWNNRECSARNAPVEDSADEDDEYGHPFNGNISYRYESSECSSSSSENESHCLSPIPDDANSKFLRSKTYFKSLNYNLIMFDKLFISTVVFLTEVIDSLERGYKEKTNPDFLILEINSSRYAYNMTLSEVNFYVVKALLNLYPIKEADGNLLTAFNQIFAQLNGVLKNYIRGDQAMTDCLKAIEVSESLAFHRKTDFFLLSANDSIKLLIFAMAQTRKAATRTKR